MAYAALLVLTKEYQQPQTRNVTTLSQKFLTVNRYPSYPDELRQGVADSGVRRENLFITNKVRAEVCIFWVSGYRIRYFGKLRAQGFEMHDIGVSGFRICCQIEFSRCLLAVLGCKGH